MLRIWNRERRRLLFSSNLDQVLKRDGVYSKPTFHSRTYGIKISAVEGVEVSMTSCLLCFISGHQGSSPAWYCGRLASCRCGVLVILDCNWSAPSRNTDIWTYGETFAILFTYFNICKIAFWIIECSKLKRLHQNNFSFLDTHVLCFSYLPRRIKCYAYCAS